MDKVIITGGAGYIGSHAVRFFLEHDYEVVVVDNLSRGFRGALDVLDKFGNLTFCEADLRDSSKLADLFITHADATAVVHFAALCSVDESSKDPSLYFTNNVFGSLNVLDAMVKANIKNIIFSSTCAVYGESTYLPINENHPLQPTNPYGESKKMVEAIINWYGKLHALNYVILRYFNVYGASEDGQLGDAKKPSVLLLQNAVRGALGIEPFKLTYSTVDTPDGSPIRDCVNVNDLIAAHFLAFKHLCAGGKSDVFNLGSGSGYSVLDIISTVERLLNVSLPRTVGAVRKGEYAKVYADNSKAKAILKWVPTRTLEDSVKSNVVWYKGHPQGYLG